MVGALTLSILRTGIAIFVTAWTRGEEVTSYPTASFFLLSSEDCCGSGKAVTVVMSLLK